MFVGGDPGYLPTSNNGPVTQTGVGSEAGGGVMVHRGGRGDVTARRSGEGVQRGR